METHHLREVAVVQSLGTANMGWGKHGLNMGFFWGSRQKPGLYERNLGEIMKTQMEDGTAGSCWGAVGRNLLNLKTGKMVPKMSYPGGNMDSNLSLCLSSSSFFSGDRRC